MFGQVLITPTLLDSVNFAKSCPPSWKDKAMTDFIGKIKREKVDYPIWVQKGLAFEDTVYRVCKNSKTIDELDGKGSLFFQEITKECYGGTFQNKLQKPFVIDDMKVYFFGYSDVEKTDLTIDLKTTINYKGAHKYLNGSQHLLYLWLNGKEKFKYVIAEWENEHCQAIEAVHTVPYTAPESREVLEGLIIDKVKALFTFIREHKLWDDYYYTFSKN